MNVCKITKTPCEEHIIDNTIMTIKKPEQCPYCELMFSSHSAVLRHMKRNVKCILQRTINELKEIKENRI